MEVTGMKINLALMVPLLKVLLLKARKKIPFSMK